MSCATSLIVAYGNALRGDDGVGVRIGAICAAAGWNTIATTALLPEHAEAIARADRVIFVDCHVGLNAGEVAVVPIDAQQATALRPASPASLLALAKDLYGSSPRAHLIGVGPETLAYREGLSASVEQAIPRVLETIDLLLAS
ncbi:MAG TPA: hydrogenase maturation protease [Vicinamibacterales bacterium]